MRLFGQLTSRRLAFGAAMSCYLGGIGCGIGAVAVHTVLLNDPRRAALIAAAIYLLLCGAVLQLGVHIVRRRN